MTKPKDATKWGENLTRIENLKTKVAEVTGQSASWQRLADRHEHGRNVAQERVRFLEAQLADARAELSEGTLPEAIDRTLLILSRSQDVIRVKHRGRA